MTCWIFSAALKPVSVCSVNSLAAAPPDTLKTPNEMDQVHRAFALRDFHMYEMTLCNGEGRSHTLPTSVVAPSPRSAVRRCASFITGRIVKLVSDYLGTERDQKPDVELMILQALQTMEHTIPEEAAQT